MADFCHDCVQDPLGPGVAGELNDMRHDGPGYIYALCEGCGVGYFDERGRRDDGVGEVARLLPADSATSPRQRLSTDEET